ncbi:unnamed protein product, partial [marine sediment metagenome]
AENCDIIITILPDTPHVEEVLVGEVINNDIIRKGGGAMEVFRGGKVEEVINHIYILPVLIMTTNKLSMLT